jgi:hypothetical protein
MFSLSICVDDSNYVWHELIATASSFPSPVNVRSSNECSASFAEDRLTTSLASVADITIEKDVSISSIFNALIMDFVNSINS